MTKPSITRLDFAEVNQAQLEGRMHRAIRPSQLKTWEEVDSRHLR